jgi:hypothetical protein
VKVNAPTLIGRPEFQAMKRTQLRYHRATLRYLEPVTEGITVRSLGGELEKYGQTSTLSITLKYRGTFGDNQTTDSCTSDESTIRHRLVYPD